MGDSAQRENFDVNAVAQNDKENFDNRVTWVTKGCIN